MRRLPLLLLIWMSASAIAQDITPQPDIDPPPVRDGGDYIPEQGENQDATNIEGDLNTSNSNNNNITKNFNGAGAGRQMPASSAISPSLMSNGQQSCLKSITGGVQVIGFGISSGKYLQDPECNRRLNSITLANMGMKVASVALMCQNAQVWRAMFMSATPCPIIKGGRLLVGRNALLAIKSNPTLWIPDYEENQAFYDQLLTGDDNGEEQESGSISDRFRTSKRERD